MKKEVMSLKENRGQYMEGFEGGERKTKVI